MVKILKLQILSIGLVERIILNFQELCGGVAAKQVKRLKVAKLLLIYPKEMKMKMKKLIKKRYHSDLLDVLAVDNLVIHMIVALRIPI